MIPLLLALPVVALGGLLLVRRSLEAERAARRREIRGPAEALGRALAMRLAVSTTAYRSGQWELSGTVFGRTTRIWVANQTTALIEANLGIGALSAAHGSQFGPGGLSTAGYDNSSHEALPEGWLVSGNVRALDRLPGHIRRWLEEHPMDTIVEGSLMLSREIPDVVEELRALQAVLD